MIHVCKSGVWECEGAHARARAHTHTHTHTHIGHCEHQHQQYINKNSHTHNTCTREVPSRVHARATEEDKQ